MIHIDFYSDNVEKDVKHALNCGASLAKYQSGDWKVLIDPAEHPFCIVPTRKNRLKQKCYFIVIYMLENSFNI